MEEKIFAAGAENENIEAGVHPLKVIVYCGLTVGVLDGLAASVSSLVQGGRPFRVFQYIASGLLGQEAFQGAWATFFLGVFLHFVIAFGASAVFVTASRFIPLLARVPFYISGPIYGVMVYFFMRDLVIPMSSVTRLNYSPGVSAVGIMIHILFVGLPIAFITSRFNKEFTS